MKINRDINNKRIKILRHLRQTKKVLKKINNKLIIKKNIHRHPPNQT